MIGENHLVLPLRHSTAFFTDRVFDSKIYVVDVSLKSFLNCKLLGRKNLYSGCTLCRHARAGFFLLTRELKTETFGVIYFVCSLLCFDFFCL